MAVNEAVPAVGGRRLAGAGVVALACLSLFLLAWWTRPLDQRDFFFDKVTESHDLAAAGPLLPGGEARQEFEAPVAGLSEIHVQLATYKRRNDSTLVMELRRGDTGRLLDRREMAAAEVRDWDWLVWRLTPLEDGGRLVLVLSSPDADEGSCLAVVTAQPRHAHRNARLTFQGRPRPEAALSMR